MDVDQAETKLPSPFSDDDEYDKLIPSYEPQAEQFDASGDIVSPNWLPKASPRRDEGE